MNNTTQERPILGFLGLGSMGGAMARNLLKAGYPLVAYDPKPERLAECVETGAIAGENERMVVEQSQFVLTSLRSSDVFVQVAESHLLPNARVGQVFIDLSTVTPPETRRIAAEFTAKGATLVDAPVSGGPGGAEHGTLRIFVGGEPSVVEQCRPILEVLGNPEHVVYCGPSGAGQIVKGVNQLAMGLGAAAYLESIAFGVLAGIETEAILKVVGGGGEHWREHFAAIACRVAQEEGESVVVKFPELPYFLREAQEQGFELPLTQVLYEFCNVAERQFRDNMNRPTVSFWHELMTRHTKEQERE